MSAWSSEVCSSDLDGVEHAVLEEELAALKALRQRLAERLLDHAGPREADERLGLGDVHVAAHREAGGHTAGRRIGRSEERWLGRECVRPCRSRWSPDILTKTDP